MGEEPKNRTRAFALGVIRLVEGLPKTQTARVLGNQLLRPGTSVGSNYRAASRSRSRAEFIAKLGIVEEEADESVCWMELLVDAGCIEAQRIKNLIQEANEILAMTVSSILTARARKKGD